MKSVLNALAAGVALLLGATPTLAQPQEGESCEATSVDIGVALQKVHESFVSLISDRQTIYEAGDQNLVMSEIGSYEITITTGESEYIITFLPRSDWGADVRGGGVRYVVRKCSRKIISMERG